MRAVTVIIRFVQLLALAAVGLGTSQARSFFDLLNGLAQGQPWNFAEFAERFAAFSCPTGLGLSLIVGLELVLRTGRVAHARSLRFPDQPWLWNRMWAERRIRLSNQTPVVICLVALGFFGFVVVPLGLWLKSKMPDAPIYIGLSILGLFVLAIMRMMWLNRRWGRSELEILTLPGVIGGPFRGTVILSEALPEGTALRVTLNCMRHRWVTMRPSGDTHSDTDTIWQDQKVLVTALSMGRPDGVAIPCSFAIPYSCEPTSVDTIGFSKSAGPDPDEHVSFVWQLSVAMKDPTDLRQVTFDVPVFRTADSSPDYREDTTVDTPFLEPVDVDALLALLPIQREYSASGKRLRISFMRPRDFLFMLLFTFAVTVGVWAIFRYVSLPGSLFAGLIPVVLAIACFKTLVEALTWRTDIEITAEATTVTAGYVWSRRRIEMPRGKLPSLECEQEFRRQNGSTYCLRLIPKDGPRCVIAKRLDGKQNATALRDWLVKELYTA
jgi:hypothetical protein